MNLNVEIQKLKEIIQKSETELTEKKKEIEKLKKNSQKSTNNICLLQDKRTKIFESQAIKKNKLSLIKKEIKLKKSYLENLYSTSRTDQDKEIKYIRDNINNSLDLSTKLVKLLNSTCNEIKSSGEILFNEDRINMMLS